MTNYTQLGAFLLGLAGVIGATVAVCLGHIDQSTYIGLVGPILGVGVGAGIHAQGATTAARTSGGAGTVAGQ